MATVTKPIALDESLNTTEQTPRNIADVLAQELSRITGRTASEVEYDNTESELTADNVQDALDEIAESVPTLPTTDIQTAVDEFSTYNGGLLSECKVALSPNQDLHGYDSPWVGGAGKNKFEVTATTTTEQGVLFNVNSDGTITTTRQSASSNNASIILGDFTLPVGSYKINGANNAGKGGYFTLRKASDNTFIANIESSGYDLNVTDATFEYRLTCVVQSAVSPTGDYTTVKPMLRLASETDPTFAPYSNICPISGHTQVEVDVSDGDTTQEQVTVNLGGTYYSGTLDVVSGVFVPDTASDDLGSLTWQTRYTGSVNKTLSSSLSQKPLWAETAGEVQCEDYKYNGKVSGASILSDPDNCEVGLYLYYVQAQESNAKVCYLVIPVDNSPDDKVVYELNDTTPIQLTPQQVKALVGENHLSAPLEGQEITESKYKQMFTFDDVIAYIQSLS